MADSPDDTPPDAPLAPPPKKALRDAKGRLLPGQVNNPRGRGASLFGQKIAQYIRKETDNGRELIKMAIEIAFGRVPGARVSDQVACLQMLLDRGFGKAPLTIDVNGGKGGMIPIEAAQAALGVMAGESLLETLAALEARRADERDDVIDVTPARVDTSGPDGS